LIGMAHPTGSKGLGYPVKVILMGMKGLNHFRVKMLSAFRRDNLYRFPMGLGLLVRPFPDTNRRQRH
jgi:hypothetical protein